MTITEAMRQALEQTQRINRLQTELALAHAARAKALEVVAPALAVQGQSESINLTAPTTPGDVVWHPDGPPPETVAIYYTNATADEPAQ
jgi:hypothetical protein